MATSSRSRQFIEHKGKKFKAERWQELIDNKKADKALSEMIKAANEDGGVEAIEEE